MYGYYWPIKKITKLDRYAMLLKKKKNDTIRHI